MQFANNTLPEEFQADHGSIDLTDDKPDLNGNKDDDAEDEDLDLDRAGQRVWLCKVRLSPSRLAAGLIESSERVEDQVEPAMMSWTGARLGRGRSDFTASRGAQLVPLAVRSQEQE